MFRALRMLSEKLRRRFATWPEVATASDVDDATIKKVGSDLEMFRSR